MCRGRRWRTAAGSAPAGKARGAGRAYAAWALAGALLAFGLVSAASVGLFFLLPAVAAAWLAFRDRRGWPATVLGVAAVALLIAALNRGPDSLDARPWLWAGVALAAAGAAIILARRAGS